MADHEGSTLDFDEIWERYAAKIRSMVFEYSSDDDFAEEVTQETLLLAFRFQDLYDPARPIWPWLATIARRVSSNMRRQQRRRQRPTESLDATPEAELAAALGGANGDPAEQFEAGESEILSKLRPRDARALVAKHIFGFKIKEIAEQEGISVDAAEVLLSRARQRFIEHARRDKPAAEWGLVALCGRVRTAWVRACVRGATAVESCSPIMDTVARVVATTGMIVAGVLAIGAGLRVDAGDLPSRSKPTATAISSDVLREVAVSSARSTATTEPGSASLGWSRDVAIAGSGADASVRTEQTSHQRSLRSELERHAPEPIHGASLDWDAVIYCDGGMGARATCEALDQVPAP